MIRALGLAMAAVAVVYVATTLPGARPDPGYDVWLDGVLAVLGQVLAALVVTVIARGRDSPLWTLLALALWLRVAGDVLRVGVSDPSEHGLAGGVLWLLSTAVVAAGLLIRIAARARSLTVLPVMDIVAGAAAITSVVLSVLFVPLEELAARSGALVTGVSVAHIVADTVVLVCILSLLAARGFRATLSRGLLAAGLTAIALSDLALHHQVGSGDHHGGSWVSGLAVAGMAVVAGAATAPDDPGGPLARPPGVWLPVAYVLIATGVMVTAAYSDVPSAALPLAVAALLVEVVRGTRTVRLQSEIADRRVSAAQVEVYRFQSLTESSSDLVCMVAPDGSLEYLNPAGHLLAGVSPHEVRSLRVTDLFTAASQAQWRDLRDLVERRGWAETELELRGADGEVPVVVSAFHIREDEREGHYSVGVVAHDITVRRRAQDDVARLAAERRELLRHLMLAQEDERTRVAHDIHDDSMQVLATLHLRLQLLDGQLASRAPDLHPDVHAALRALEGAMERLRHLMFDLDSPARREGLVTAVEQAAEHVLDDVVDWRLTHRVERDLSEELRVTAYRIAVEALVNVRRHAAAETVVIDLRAVGDTLAMVITDDGRGLPPGRSRPAPGHLGLAGMHDRARAAGGTVVVEAGAGGRGTRVRVELPIERADDVATPTGAPPEGLHVTS